jgi:hypothetical protein
VIGSARHVFFPVHKIGFCLSHQTGMFLDGGWFGALPFTSLLFWVAFSCLFSFVYQIVFSVRVGCDTGISF